MIYKRLTFSMEKKKVQGAIPRATIYDFTIKEEGNKNPVFEMGVMAQDEESAKGIMESVFIRKLYNKEIKI